MLLLIAVANAPYFLWGHETGWFGAHAIDGSVADHIAQFAALIAIDGRAYPVFAFLFGYGIVQLYRRQTASGVDPKQARRLLRKRQAWMLAFGLLHAALLWFGDVIGAYGLAGLVLCWLFLDRGDRSLRVWIGVLFAVLLSITLGAAALGDVDAPTANAIFLQGPNPNSDPDYLHTVGERLLVWLMALPLTAVFGLVVPIAMLTAFLAARHRVLEEPEKFPRLLRSTAVVGVVIGWSVGLLVALQKIDAFGFGHSADSAFAAAHSVSGLIGGMGYVALFALIAERLGRPARGGRLLRALVATGRRSMSAYLLQSVFFGVVLAAWGFGLGDVFSSWSVAVFAIAVWVVCLVFCLTLERMGRRGPAEWLLRRLSASASR